MANIKEKFVLTQKHLLYHRILGKKLLFFFTDSGNTVRLESRPITSAEALHPRSRAKFRVRLGHER